MTQIKATILTGGNHIETVSFPCSDDEIMRLTEQNEVGHKAIGRSNKDSYPLIPFLAVGVMAAFFI